MAIDETDDDTRLYIGPRRDADLLEVVTILTAAAVSRVRNCWPYLSRLGANRGSRHGS
jgi:hypothetical protein